MSNMETQRKAEKENCRTLTVVRGDGGEADDEDDPLDERRRAAEQAGQQDLADHRDQADRLLRATQTRCERRVPPG